MDRVDQLTLGTGTVLPPMELGVLGHYLEHRMWRDWLDWLFFVVALTSVWGYVWWVVLPDLPTPY